MADQIDELQIRRRLVDALHADLIGPFVPPDHPAGGEEILTTAPSRGTSLDSWRLRAAGRRMSTTRSRKRGGLTSDNDSPAEDAGETEPEPKRPARFPASMGLSVFLPPGEGDALEVDLRFADYDKIEIAEDHDKRKLTAWKRVPHEEAYLGLIAFTLVLRRLRGKREPEPHEGRGAAVILRYTLRLLDQLGRAATLMCALEEMRRRDPKRLGNARFTVGLWVGAAATANRLKDVHEALHDYTPGRQDSPFPLTSCPWCGVTIRIHNIKLVDAAGKPSKTKYTRAVVYCEGEGDIRAIERRNSVRPNPRPT